MGRVKLTDVRGPGSARRRRCAKLGCATKDYAIHRHHRGNEKLLLEIMRPIHGRTKEFHKRIKRYFEFHADDVVPVCAAHHAEIHAIYNALDIIGTNLWSWSWRDVDDKAKVFRAACDEWLRKSTPGVEGGFKPRPRRRRQRQRKKE